MGRLANRLGLTGLSTEPRIEPLELVTNGDRDIVEFSVDSVSFLGEGASSISACHLTHWSC